MVSLTALSVLTAFFEGVGIAFLIPVLEAIEGGGELTPSHAPSRVILGAFEAIGIPPTLVSVMLVGFSIFLIHHLLVYWKAVLTQKLEYRFMTDLRSSMFRGLLEGGVGYFEKSRVGSFVNSIVTESQRAAAALSHMVILMSAVGIVAVYLTVAVIISWRLTLIALTLLGVATLLLQRRIKRANVRGLEVSRANDALHRDALDTLSGMRIVKSFGREGREGGRFSSRADSVADTLIELAVSASRLNFVYATAVTAVTLLVVYVAVVHLQFSTVLLITFLVILVRLQPWAQRINTSRHRLGEYLPGYENIAAVIEQARSEREAWNQGSKHFDGFDNGIKLEGVSFGYDGTEQVLRDVSLEVKAGNVTAVVGASGAGKSTVVDLVMRFYDPDEGRLTVDGLEVTEFDLRSYREGMAVVTQEPFLFNGTVRENILYGRLEASEEEVVAAACRAHAHEFIEAFPSGYDTIVGDRGVLMSGGQRQRLALARALVRRPHILMLDEATSNLDSKSERLIQQSIHELRGSCTVLIIAHRLSTVEMADHIYVLEDGKVVEEGRHEDLMGMGGVYSEYYRIQSMSEPFKVSAGESGGAVARG